MWSAILCGDVICPLLHVSVSADIVTIWLMVMWGAYNEICLQNMEKHHTTCLQLSWRTISASWVYLIKNSLNKKSVINFIKLHLTRTEYTVNMNLPLPAPIFWTPSCDIPGYLWCLQMVGKHWEKQSLGNLRRWEVLLWRVGGKYLRIMFNGRHLYWQH